MQKAPRNLRDRTRSASRPRWLLVLWVACALPVDGQAQGAPPGQLVREQVKALQAEKAARTPAERKLGSRLVHALRVFRGRPIAPGGWLLS